VRFCPIIQNSSSQLRRGLPKFLTDCFQWFSPLNPPMLGDFKLRSPPSIGGLRGTSAPVEAAIEMCISGSLKGGDRWPETEGVISSEGKCYDWGQGTSLAEPMPEKLMADSQNGHRGERTDCLSSKTLNVSRMKESVLRHPVAGRNDRVKLSQSGA